MPLASHFVKEFGEGFDRICREQDANGANVPSFRTDEFILKITVPKVAENVTDTSQKAEQKLIIGQETEQKPNRKRAQVDRKTYCDIAINER